MLAKLRSTRLFVAALLVILATACTFNLPAQINVACDTNDLIQAIHDANADTDTTTLILDANCTYTFTSKDNEDGGQGPNALPIITTNIIIQGNASILDRASGTEFRFFLITGTGSLRLDDLTLQDGNASGAAFDQPQERGGAIYNDGGSLNARRSTFSTNQASWGGAIYNLGTLTLEDNTILEFNLAYDDGGAVYIGGDVGIPTSIQDTSFVHNSADNGAAIYFAPAEMGMTITGSDFSSNLAYEDGGAIYGLGGDLDVSNTEFLQQTAYGLGGAIYIDPSSSLHLRGGWLESNEACLGGGLYAGGTTEILETTFNGNSAESLDLTGGGQACSEAVGGAVFNEGTLLLSRSLLENNSAVDEGDGIYNLGDLVVVNSTFTFNVHGQDHAQAINNLGDTEVSLSTFVMNGLHNSGVMAVKNVIVYGSGSHADCVNSGTFNAIAQNIGIDPTCPFNTIMANPLAVGINLVLADHGGPTLTHEIYTTSPAVNYASCSTVAGDPVTEDQRGLPRPMPSGSSCDIGAFELQWEGTGTSPGEDHPPTATGTSEPETALACAPQNTTCREGDSSEYEALGYLLEGECADVVGRNQDATWLVIINPDWEGECWVLRDLIETEGDVDGTEVRYAPALPTKTPTEQLGCWVQDTRGGDPVCTVPCPAGAEPGTPCAP